MLVFTELKNHILALGFISTGGAKMTCHDMHVMSWLIFFVLGHDT